MMSAALLIYYHWHFCTFALLANEKDQFDSVISSLAAVFEIMGSNYMSFTIKILIVKVYYLIVTVSFLIVEGYILYIFKAKLD